MLRQHKVWNTKLNQFDKLNTKCQIFDSYETKTETIGSQNSMANIPVIIFSIAGKWRAMIDCLGLRVRMETRKVFLNLRILNLQNKKNPISQSGYNTILFSMGTGIRNQKESIYRPS